MKLQPINRRTVSGAAVLIGALALHSSWAQEPQNNSYRAQRQEYVKAQRTYADAMRKGDGASPFVMAMGEPDARSAIRQAAEELRDAEGDEELAKAEANIRDLLANYFEEDMNRRQAELEEMEKRLQQLHEQLARRRTKMQDIIDLQVQVLVNEANGLGFFSNTPSDLKLQGQWPNGLPNSPFGTPTPTTIVRPTQPTRPLEATPAQPPIEPRSPALPRAAATTR